VPRNRIKDLEKLAPMREPVSVIWRLPGRFTANAEGAAVMKRTFILVTLAGLGCLTGACGTREDVSLDGLRLPVAQTRSAAPPTEPAGPGDGAGAADDADAPVPKPTVAKTQKWVKIFSGPSEKDLTPPADKRRGTRTVELDAVPDDRIGTFVTDGAGRTLYRFDNDRAAPPKATCNGDCATAWPPLLIKSPGRIFPKGIDPKIIGYVERADGHCQVTIDGWPVYYFIADARPGDVNGQGVNGKWFAVAPDGTRTRRIPGFPLATPGK
jgi:predicted lipoprotein with Yx(FWY)xxD motif